MANRILILTASHLCRNPRVVKEATTLGRAGYDVTVLTISTQSRLEQVDRAFTAELPFRRLTLDYTGFGRWQRFRRFTQRATTWTARRLCHRLRLEFAQSLGPSGALRRRALGTPADLTIVHTEIPIWCAQYLIRRGRRVAVDVEDWYSEDLLYADRRTRPIRLLRRAERLALNRCTYSSAMSQAMADALTAAYACPPPIVLRNTFPLQPVSRVDRPLEERPPRLIWFSQTIGPGRGLELFFAAWSRTQAPSEVYLLGDERPGYVERLLGRLPAERRAQVHCVPIVPPDALPARLAEFDIGLALESHLPLNRDITITNKILQYMNAGLALVATDTAGQVEVMRTAPESGLLVQAHETTQLAVQLDSLLNDPVRLRACQEASRAAAVREFCWECDAPRLLAAVDRSLPLPLA